MKQDSEYFIFISYSSKDKEWAIWLRHELEHYHLPASFNGRTDVRDNLRKVFRDRDELSAGPEWDDQVKQALANTNNLIVICSPHAAESDAVNKEIETFIALGKEDHIFPFIVEGDKPEDCFPKALRHSKLGGDVNKDGGRDTAFIKVVAGMLKVSFPSLWNRYEVEKAEEERKIREQRDKLLIMQSRFLAEKANALVDEGDSYTARLLALEALPKDLENPDKPYVPEAEYALRIAVNAQTFVLKHNTRLVSVSPDGQQNATGSKDNEILLWNKQNGVVEHILKGHTGRILGILYSSNGKHIISTARDGCINIWDSQTGELIRSLQEAKITNEIAHKLVKCQLHVDITSPQSQTKLEDFMSFFNSDSHEKKASPPPQTNVGAYDFMFSPIAISKTEKKTEIPYSTDISVSADGKILASVGRSRNVLIWNTDTGELLSVFESPMWPNNVVSISPSGKKLFVASGFPSSQQYGSVWDIPSKKLLFCVEVDSYSVYTAVFSKDEDNIMIACSDSVKILDSEIGDVEKTILQSLRTPICAFYTNDEKHIVTASEKSIDLWDTKTLELYKTLGSHTGEIKSMAVSSDGMTIVSCSEDGIVKIWDCHDSNCLSEERCMNKVCEVSIDKSKIKCDIDVDLLDDICCVDYSPDSQYMLTGLSNETIMIWDVQTGTKVYSIDADYFNDAYFSNDGKQIVAITRYNTRRWPFPPLQQLINETRVRFKNRELAPEERKKYYLD